MIIDNLIFIFTGVGLGIVLFLYALIPQGDENPKYPDNGCEL